VRREVAWHDERDKPAVTHSPEGGGGGATLRGASTTVGGATARRSVTCVGKMDR
jgi:hypothetical protein